MNKELKELFGDKVEFAFSTTKDGPMNFVGNEVYDSERRANRGAFLKYNFGLKGTDTVVPKLMHTARVEVVDAHNPVWGAITCDAVVTGKKNLALTVSAGDCPPVVLYDPVQEVVALIHAGWRPLVAGIIAHTVEAMRIQLNCSASNIKAYIGVGICRQCYEIQEDVGSKFGIEKPANGGKMYLSLSDEINKRLLDEGIRKENILATMECTSCTDNGEKYYSWRRDRSDPLNCQMAVVVMR